MAIGRGAGFVGAQAISSLGLSGKTHILQMGVGGGAISQAQIDGIINGLATGASLQTADTSPQQYTVVGINEDFAAASSTTVYVAVQGQTDPSEVTGDYFASATCSIVCTFSDNSND